MSSPWSGVGTPFFSGASFFAAEGTPAFGYVVDPGLEQPPQPVRGLRLRPGLHHQPAGEAYLAKQLQAKSVAVVAYDIAASSRRRLPVGGQRPAGQAGIHVGFQDLAFPSGEPHRRRAQMKSAHVDMYVSCMDGTDNLAFDQAMDQYGMTDVNAVWLNGYDRAT